MKKYLSLLPLIAIASAILCGCAHERVVVRAAQTNDVQVLATNAVPQVLHKEVVSTRLNPVPGQPDIVTTNWITETNILERVVTNTQRVITPEVAYTNLSISPGANTAIQVGGAVAPGPWGAAFGLFGTAAGGVLALINNQRRKKALGQMNDWASTAKVLVENVEAVRQQALKLPGYTEAIDKKVVRVLEETQRAAGVKWIVEGLVDAHTDYTTDPEPSAPSAPAPASAPLPPPIERPVAGDPPNRPVSELVAFAKGGQKPIRGEWSASDIVSILEIRGQV